MQNDFVKFFIILPLIVILLAAGTSYAIFTYLGPGGPEEEEEAEDEGPSYSLGDFVVNLKGTEGYQYLQTSIVVRASNEEVVEELDDSSPQVRDAIINILGEQNISKIEEDGNETVKNEIRTRLNDIINNGEVVDVWFTQFVIQ
ncbi:MAG: flagellar basal body-associated FliL family protein [Bacillota bacterium]